LGKATQPDRLIGKSHKPRQRADGTTTPIEQVKLRPSLQTAQPDEFNIYDFHGAHIGSDD
jgi:hypothetical protein